MKYKSLQPPRYTDSDGILENTQFEYVPYRKEDTYIVSGSLGGKDKPWISGRHFNSLEEAKDWVTKTFGGYYECIRGALPDRWAFRVKKGSHIQHKEGTTGLLREESKPKFRVIH